MYEIDLNKPVNVHFIGIGGISMSGLSRLLLSRGFKVSGSDAKESALTEELREKGIVVSIGQAAENIPDQCDFVVYTAAISPENPEYAAAAERKIPMLSRAQLLGQLMKNYRTPIAVAGTHGKTTTTSMVSEILLNAGTDPTLAVGGILKSIGGNLRIGRGDHFVLEACEYTNSFLEFFPRISIVLNIEEDHLDFFKDINDIRASFKRFMELLPEDGCLIVNNSIPALEELTGSLKCPVIRFGEGGDYHPSDISFDEQGRASYIMHHGEESVPVKLGVVGKHNVYNSLSAIALADYLGIDRKISLDTLKDFTGSDRRFEHKGELGGISIIDDYAHHPTEIRATLSSALNLAHRKLFCVFQPHTYSRTKAFLKEFADALSAADEVILADIFAAREKNTIGISSRDLQKALKDKGCDAHYFPYFDDIETYLLEHAEAGDIILTMGAGDIYRVGERLLGK
ncbi:MAG: UDP-N-acetylmuramate--L-alanine ligase [Lachnospiraceae bacterium]|nr:UDP-N-acetylmuramate--L-alanine ligase [Lachnospiraceae bacterium]